MRTDLKVDEAEKMSVVVIGGFVSSTYIGLAKRKDRRPLYLVLNVGSRKILSEEERGSMTRRDIDKQKRGKLDSVVKYL